MGLSGVSAVNTAAAAWSVRLACHFPHTRLHRQSLGKAAPGVAEIIPSF